MCHASEKIATLEVFVTTYSQPATQPNTDHYTDSHFSCESKKLLKQQQQQNKQEARQVSTEQRQQ